MLVLVGLDVGLPDLDGCQVLERLRELSDVPVLILTARTLEAEKVRSLHSGADDYVTKPFGREELAARVHALLRRASTDRPTVADSDADELLGIDGADSPIEAVRGFGYRYRPAREG